MPVLKVVITAQSPLVFSERRPGGQFRPSAPYVPGAALRGSLAQQMIDAEEPTEGGDFATLLLGDGAPLFRNAYPDGARPLPATAFSCKAESGFDKHGVFDSLIDRLCCEELGVKIPYLPLCLHQDHNGEPDRVEAFTGFYVAEDGRKKSVGVPARLVTRVAINRRRRAAEEGLLYSPLVLSEARGKDQPLIRYEGSIVVSAQSEPVVRRWLPEVNHVGSGPARGLGWVKVKVKDAADDDLAGRLQEFNHLLGERWELWKQLPRDGAPSRAPGSGTFFAILLVSDAILREDGWTSTVRLQPDMLGVAGTGATLLRCYANLDYRGGWNTAWGLPKDTELVARMGSVYLYHTPRAVDDESLLADLRTLEEQGAGERRQEGFGQVRVCDEFHQEIQEAKA